MGRFDELKNEFTGNPYQTKEIKHRDIQRIKNVMCAICVDYINHKDWNIKVNPGSITFTNKFDNRKVIKLFIDYGKSLADKIGLKIAEKDPIIIGLELGHFDPFVRKQIRNWLRTANKNGINYYVDPVIYTNWPKTTLLPIQDHYYDILFLKTGFCEYSENKEINDYIDSLFEKILQEKGEFNE